jgi:hypothetical protein
LKIFLKLLTGQCGNRTSSEVELYILHFSLQTQPLAKSCRHDKGQNHHHPPAGTGGTQL